MACYKVAVTVTDKDCGGEQGCSWKYTFYTRLNPNPLDPPTQGLSPEDQKRERELRNDVSDPLNIVRDPQVPRNPQKKKPGKACAIKVKDYASNGSWTVTYDKNKNNQEAYKKPTVPYGGVPPWGNLGEGDEGKKLEYKVETDPVGDGSCDQDFTSQEIGDQQGSTDCGCQGSGDSGLADFSGGGFGGLSQSFNAQNTTTMEDFVNYIESLQSSCLSDGGVKFTLQFACLPKNIVLEPFSFPSGWSSFSDAQKINFLNSKVTLLQQALGNSYYQEISLKTNCLKSAGTIINGHIYKQ